MNDSKPTTARCSHCGTKVIEPNAHWATTGYPQCCGQAMELVQHATTAPVDETWEANALKATIGDVTITVEEGSDPYRGRDYVSWHARSKDGFTVLGSADDMATAKDRALGAIGILHALADAGVSNFSVPYPVGATDVDLVENGRCLLCGNHGEVCFHPATELRAFIRGVRAVKGDIPF